MDGPGKLNLAEALRRKKYYFINEQGMDDLRAKESALKCLVLAECDLLEDLNHIKPTTRGGPIVENLDDWAYYINSNLIEYLLKRRLENIPLIREVPKGSISNLIDDLYSKGVGWDKLYSCLSKAVWDVERRDISDAGRMYAEILNSFKKRVQTII